MSILPKKRQELGSYQGCSPPPHPRLAVKRAGPAREKQVLPRPGKCPQLRDIFTAMDSLRSGDVRASKKFFGSSASGECLDYDFLLAAPNCAGSTLSPGWHNPLRPDNPKPSFFQPCRQQRSTQYWEGQSCKISKGLEAILPLKGCQHFLLLITYFSCPSSSMLTL